MSTPPRKIVGDVTPVAGGCRIPSAVLRKSFPDLPDDTDDLTRHLLRLLSLHSGLSLNFRADDISAMTKDDKVTLLQDINDVLGIKPLKTV